MHDAEMIRQLTVFGELVKHLATKAEMEKMRSALILWIIGTNLAVGAAIIGVALYLNTQLTNQFTLLLQHWKP
jgi:hypothetical protein